MAGITWEPNGFTVTGLGNQGGSQGSPSGWDTVDADGASYFNNTMSNAAAVILDIHVTATGADRAIGFRHGDSTDVFYRDWRRDSHSRVIVPVNASNEFDIAVETAADVTVRILGWIENDICKGKSAAESFSVSSADTPETKTLTSEGGDTAKFVFGIWDGTGQSNYNGFVRHADESTWARNETVYRGGFGGASLNASEQFDLQISNTSVNFRALGYFYGDDFTSVQSPTDLNSGLSDGTYGNITTQSADFIIYLPMNTAGVSAAHAWECRDTADTLDVYADQNREQGFTIVRADGNGQHELKLQDVSDQEFWRIGYGDNPSGAGPQTVSPSGIASLEAFGTTVIDTAVTITVTGIASEEAFGTTVLALGGVTILPAGIETAEAFGTPVLTGGVVIAPNGIPSEELFGTATLATGPVTILPAGIASAEAVPAPNLGGLIVTDIRNLRRGLLGTQFEGRD